MLEKYQKVLAAVADLAEEFPATSSVTVTATGWVIVLGEKGELLRAHHPNKPDFTTI